MCVDADYCKKHRRQPIDGECRQKCDSLETNNGINSGFGSNTTPSHCSRSCSPVDVDSLATSDYVRGCQIIAGDLYISIHSGDINTQKYLERNLGDIEEVYGQLRVYRSHAITSLSFLRNLRVIRGMPNPRYNIMKMTTCFHRDHFLIQILNWTLLWLLSSADPNEKTNYTFQILSNDNLQELWDFREKKSLKLENGNLLVHYNSKLCLSQVRELQNILGTNKTDDFIGTESNGYEQTCLSRAMATYEKVINHTSVEIFWEKLNVTKDEKITGSVIYYVVAPERNITYLGMDTCVQ